VSAVKGLQVIVFGLFLLVSAGIYLVQVIVFQDGRNTVFYMLQDMAFLPVQAVLVTGFINVLLNRREKIAKRQRTNMTIGVFYGEAGGPLIAEMLAALENRTAIADMVRSALPMSEHSYRALLRNIAELTPQFGANAAALEGLRAFLIQKRGLVLDFLRSGDLLEHERFAELLWAVLHLADELAARGRLADLPAEDVRHLHGDCVRVLRLLIPAWADYVRHLRDDYPYMYAFVLRVNPFVNDDSTPSAVTAIVRQ
jgi:hypothetical protein